MKSLTLFFKDGETLMLPEKYVTYTNIWVDDKDGEILDVHYDYARIPRKRYLNPNSRRIKNIIRKYDRRKLLDGLLIFKGVETMVWNMSASLTKGHAAVVADHCRSEAERK